MGALGVAGGALSVVAGYFGDVGTGDLDLGESGLAGCVAFGGVTGTRSAISCLGDLDLGLAGGFALGGGVAGAGLGGIIGFGYGTGGVKSGLDRVLSKPDLERSKGESGGPGLTGGLAGMDTGGPGGDPGGVG